MPAQGEFPTRENCDPTDPESAFLWMFVGMPGDLRMPMSYHRLVSQRFWDLGARPAEEPKLELVAPRSIRQTWVNPGHWRRVDGKNPKPQKPKTEPLSVIPTRGKCNLADPEEALLWMWVALPGVRGGPMLLSESAHRKDSQHLWDLGVRPVEEPILEYLPPSGAQADWATSPGRWVPAGSISVGERQRLEMASGLAKLGQPQKAELAQCLRAVREGRALPDTKAAAVVRGLTPVLRELMWEMLDDVA